ncbi:hypothetical protein C5167_035268 [Papaver somniferum]|uniref:Uncharacterized protein n=1 Tax=Papaver somniferum TaxID=3469 RepID=A0A4Y7KI24_PAPSO|nr:hypothetical protein C5167_035268 [Papaver somniferum]
MALLSEYGKTHGFQVWNVLHSLFSPTEATATSSIHIMGDNELKGLIKNTHSKNSLVPQFRHKLMKIGLDFKLHSEESMHYAWPSTFSFAHFKSSASETPTNQRQWVPPTSHIKINVDAAFGNTDGVAAAIARDSNGNI